VCDVHDPTNDPSRLRPIGIDVAALGPAAVADVAVFDKASTADEVDDSFRREVRAEVHAILELFEGCDAFDVIELLRLRELPLSPELALADGYDGVLAVVELVTSRRPRAHDRRCEPFDRHAAPPARSRPSAPV
jgi:hypothetical protein